MKLIKSAVALLLVVFDASALGTTGTRSGARLASAGLDRRAVTQTLIAACTVSPQAKPSVAYGEFEPGAKGAKKKSRAPAPAPTKPPTPGGAYNPGAEAYGKSLK